MSEATTYLELRDLRVSGSALHGKSSAYTSNKARSSPSSAPTGGENHHASRPSAG